MQHLKDLIQMGFSPMVALVIVAMIVLWGTLCAVVVYMYRSSITERNKRDQIREAWHADVEKKYETVVTRLDSSEEKHKACEDDRTELRDELDDVKTDLERIKRCPRQNCPMRLPR